MAEATLDDPLLTTFGLFLEAHAGLTRELERRLERDCGLSVAWFEVLLRLARTPEHRLRMSDLAAQATLTASGLTRAVDRLAAAGLVRREACPTDRRVAYATLTDDGLARLEASVPVQLGHVRELVAGVLEPREIEALGAIMRKLRDAANPLAAAASLCPTTVAT